MSSTFFVFVIGGPLLGGASQCVLSVLASVIGARTPTCRLLKNGTAAKEIVRQSQEMWITYSRRIDQAWQRESVI
eukprot:1494050-Pleurochrysis_carterae.AAC.3